ncbi:TauD/TfdA family dioxygenase [Paenibacillus filicis]|uniref:TauD/TfdA family dioxygenase n=1 Tax=Paenibacillus filicis TaxID=669464 RepID=A0ABU9DD11_9BACL
MSTQTVDTTRHFDLEVRKLFHGARKLERTSEAPQGIPFTLFQVKRLSNVIGAEIEGVDLSQPLSTELKEELHRALLAYKVIFFRNQEITSQQQKAFASNWGELETHPFAMRGDIAEVVRLAKDDKVAGRENVWHTDVSWRLEPSLGAVLRLTEVPGLGGDTSWVDMEAAYTNLPDEVKNQIDGLSAIHDFTPSFGRALDPETLAQRQLDFPAAEHPIVRTHPETGRKALFVNPVFTTRVVGLDPDEGEQLLQHLFRQAEVPEYQVRFRWEPNTIAFWDNRNTQHYAVSDYFPDRRVAERISIIGDRPF